MKTPNVVVVLLKPCSPLNAFEVAGFPADQALAMIKRGDAMYPEEYAQQQAELASKKAEQASELAKKTALAAELRKKELAKQARDLELIREGKDPGVPDLPDGPPANKAILKKDVIRK